VRWNENEKQKGIRKGIKKGRKKLRYRRPHMYRV
jgi:hypothetical protein